MFEDEDEDEDEDENEDENEDERGEGPTGCRARGIAPRLATLSRNRVE